MSEIEIPSGATPGPWRIHENSGHIPEECSLSICGDVFILARIEGPNYAHCDANARLIAAAPDMAAELHQRRAQASRDAAELARRREVIAGLVEAVTELFAAREHLDVTDVGSAAIHPAFDRYGAAIEALSAALSRAQAGDGEAPSTPTWEIPHDE